MDGLRKDVPLLRENASPLWLSGIRIGSVCVLVPVIVGEPE